MSADEVLHFCVLNSHDRTTGVHNRNWVPLCLLNCIALLRASGREGKLVTEQQVSELPANSIIVVTTSSIDRWFAPSIRVDSLYAFCARFSDRHRIFISGIHPTLFPEVIERKCKPAGILRGMPEAAIEHYCATGVLAGDYRNVDLDLRKFPVPAFDQVRAENHVFPPMGWDRFGVFEFGRGCSEDCSYCAKACFYGSLKSWKTPEQMVGELRTAVRDHGFRSGYFMDICFLNNRAAAKELCRQLGRERLDFVWACETRLADLDASMVDLLAEAGCKMVGFGVAPGTTAAQKELVTEIERRGIKTLAYYIASPLFSSITADDEKIFVEMRTVNSTFANPRRFLNLHDPSWLEAEILKDVPYAQDALDYRLRREILRYHLAPVRARRILSGIDFANAMRAAKTFGNLLLRR